MRNMTFFDFVSRQVERDDVGGQFARIVVAEQNRPAPDAPFVGWKQYLRDRPTEDIGVFTGLWLLWREWERQASNRA
jgi:hypothetical protein